MKILVICQYYYPEPFRISDICETLVKKGHEVTVLTGLPNYPEGKVLNEYKFNRRRQENIGGVQVIRTFEIGRGKNRLKLFLNYLSFAMSASLKSLFIKEKYDVVLVNQLSPVLMGIPAILYKKKQQKKMLLYCLDLWPASLVAGGINENSFVYKIFLKISRYIYNSADEIGITSKMFENYLSDKIITQKKVFHYLPQYAEDLFSDFEKTKKTDGEYHFVFAGNIGEMQSVDTIVKAANLLRDNSKIIFHIVGDGSKLIECKDLAQEYNITNVIFYGRKPVAEMSYFYGIADAMLVTLKDNETISYTLPGKVQSYMAASKPIVGAINGETAKVIKEVNCGLCCPAEDYKKLANIIIEFCNSDRKNDMAINSYKFYKDNCTKDKFIEKLERVLINLEVK